MGLGRVSGYFLPYPAYNTEPLSAKGAAAKQILKNSFCSLISHNYRDIDSLSNKAKYYYRQGIYINTGPKV